MLHYCYKYHVLCVNNLYLYPGISLSLCCIFIWILKASPLRRFRAPCFSPFFKKKWTLWVYMRSLENYKVSITRHFVSSVWYKCICNNYRWPTLTVSSVLTKLSWRLSVSIWMKQFRRGFWFRFKGESLGGALHHPLQPLSQVNESRKYTQDFLT